MRKGTGFSSIYNRDVKFQSIRTIGVVSHRERHISTPYSEAKQVFDDGYRTNGTRNLKYCRRERTEETPRRSDVRATKPCSRLVRLIKLKSIHPHYIWSYRCNY